MKVQVALAGASRQWCLRSHTVLVYRPVTLLGPCYSALGDDEAETGNDNPRAVAEVGRAQK
jgi:hypothetical protein